MERGKSHVRLSASCSAREVGSAAQSKSKGLRTVRGGQCCNSQSEDKGLRTQGATGARPENLEF